MPLTTHSPVAFAQQGASADEISSDFNGDGYDDLAVGANSEKIGTEENAGAVNVIYGSSSGLRTSASGSTPADQFWHQNSAGVDNSVEEGDSFGSSLATGDFNGDGFADLAIGVPFEDIGTARDAGAVHILYGTSNGLQSTSPPDQFWHQGKPGVEDSEEPSDQFGSSLTVGDFNNDGKDDLAIGVIGEVFESAGRQGAVHVLNGASGGLQTSSPADQFWSKNSPGMAQEPNNEVENDGGENFGYAVKAGDFNNDAFDDLAIGMPGEILVGECCGGGAVVILYGSSFGLQTSSPKSQFWSQESPGVEDSAESDPDDGDDRFGSALAAGDFNGDGFDDLAIGSELMYPRYGGVNVIYGSSSGLQVVSPLDQFWDQNSPGVESTSRNHERFGGSLATGDFNNDGKADLAIGAPAEGVGASDFTGAVHVLYGASTGLQTSTPADQIWHQNSPGVENASNGEGFGWALG
jgi:hypothetical protein